MSTAKVARTGHLGWAGVLTIALMWVAGAWTSHEPLTIGARSSVLTGVWAVLHGLMLVGALVAVAIQRLPRRPGVVLGLMLALVSTLGIEIIRVAVVMHDGIPLAVAAVGVLIFLLGLAPTMLCVGAIGGWVGSVLTGHESSTVIVVEPGVEAPGHLTPTLRELFGTTTLARTTLEGRRGPLGTMESTLAFSWIESLRALDEQERERLRWRGVEVGPVVRMLHGRVRSSRMRARMIDSMTRVLDGLRDDVPRPCYR